MKGFLREWRSQRKTMRTLERLAREQDGVAEFSVEEFMAATRDHRMTDDEWERWQAAMREVRGDD